MGGYWQGLWVLRGEEKTRVLRLLLGMTPDSYTGTEPRHSKGRKIVGQLGS